MELESTDKTAMVYETLKNLKLPSTDWKNEMYKSIL